MNFVHKLRDFETVESTMVDGVRYYQTPGGFFPSVTTVIGSHKGDAELVAWRKRVGDEMANKVVGQSRVRGTAVHTLAERYVTNDPQWMRGAMPMNLDSFLSIRGLLDKHVGSIYGIEAPLWSSVLKTAGRTDLVADWDGVPSIVDFKTSRRIKKESDVWGYFIQKTCYGEMVGERISLDVPRIVTVMMVDHEPPQVWVKERSEYRPAMYKVFVDAPRDGKLRHMSEEENTKASLHENISEGLQSAGDPRVD
jgi:hypothetical protein